MLYHESLFGSAARIASEYGMSFNKLHLVGVYPTFFPRRSDVAIAIAAVDISGKPTADGFEFSQFRWLRQPPAGIGANYRRMVCDWKRKRKSRTYLELSSVPVT